MAPASQHSLSTCKRHPTPLHPRNVAYLVSLVERQEVRAGEGGVRSQESGVKSQKAGMRREGVWPAALRGAEK